MRKQFFIITLLLVSALAISACSAGTPVSSQPTAGSTSPVVPTTGSSAGTAVPTVVTTSAATAEATGSTTTLAPTVGATTAATAAGTAAATSAATSAATAASTGTTGGTVSTPLATQTSAAGTGTNGTPQAGIPDQFVRLSTLLQSKLATASDTGQVSGVVIAQPQPSTTNGTADVKVPYVRYVVVNTGSGTGELLLPWQMFAFEPAVSTANGVSQNFTLNGTAAARANAPRVSLPTDTGVLTTGFDSQLAQYWAGEGFTVPVTGASTQEPGTQVLLRKTFNGANIVGTDKQALGQIGDFLIDPTTGEFAYAVFNGGQLFGNRLFVVPVRSLNFQLGSASAAGLGDVQLNITPDLLKNAPSIKDLNQMLDPTLLQQLNDFWK